MNTNPTSQWDADDYRTHGRFVAEHGAAVLALLDPRPGEHILDLGCGDGALTAEISAAGATVVGLDASAELVAAARKAGIDARVGDGARLPFTQEFDAVFSNAALHWMLDPAPVAKGMFTALRPGGRLAAEFGGFGNIAAIRTALAAAMTQHGYPDADPGQYYPTASEYASVLAAAGFTSVQAELIPRQTRLPATMTDWLRTFRQGFLDAHDIPAELQSAIIADAVALLDPVLRDGTTWYADYVRLRVTATRPTYQG